MILAFLTGFYCSSCDWDSTPLDTVSFPQPVQWYGHPTWSPTGQWIAYEYWGPEGPLGSIWLVRPDGSENHFLTKGTQPDFSPDGKTLALVQDGTIVVYDLETREITQLTFKGHEVYPDWSPDGKQIAYYDTRDHPPLRLMTARGENKRPLVPLEYNEGANPQWFPDYKILLERWTKRENRNAIDIFVMDTTGNNLIQLTQSGEMNSIPKVSPDGKRIVWQRKEYRVNEISVWLMNSDGNDKVRLTAGMEPAWAPDGVHIVFRKRGDFMPGQPWDDEDPKVHGSLWIMNVNTREQWQLLPPN